MGVEPSPSAVASLSVSMETCSAACARCSCLAALMTCLRFSRMPFTDDNEEEEEEGGEEERMEKMTRMNK